MSRKSISLFLSFATENFFTLGNAFDLLNTSSVNIIFAVGLLVVLIAGGIDISFAVAASVVQYGTAIALGWIGGGTKARGGGGAGSGSGSGSAAACGSAKSTSSMLAMPPPG